MQSTEHMRFYSSIVLSLNFLFAAATTATALDASGVNQEPEWEYEPIIWTPDEEPTGASDDFGEPKSDSHTSICDGSIGDNCGSFEDVERQQQQDQSLHDDDQDPHRSQYFVRNLLRQGEQKPRCTQWEVDAREAVICNKRRCDKFEFEWPKYDNQLTLIESTKHGMRFHRVDYAFAETVAKRSIHKPVSFNRDVAFNADDSKIKFDLFDLFKPKPSSTTTTTTPTSPFFPITPIYPIISTVTTNPTTETADNNTEIVTTMAPTVRPNTTESEQNNTITTMPTNTDSETTTPHNESTTDAPERNGSENDEKLITTFRLSTRRPKQTIIGFGGALSDSTCYNIKSLSPQMARSLMEDYYGDKGLRYNIARMSIGSSDFSLTPYTNNDRSNDSKIHRQQESGNEEDDVEMRNFHLVPEDYDYKLPVARQAIATSRQEVKFFSSMWSPPIWMKNNSDIVHGFLKGDVYGPYYRALGEYMVKWLDAYRRNGLEFWGMTVMNEPITGVKPFIFHNSLGIAKEDYVIFIKLYLGPIIKRYGFDKIKLIALDDNKGYAPNWARAVLDDKEAAKYVSGIAVHWYMNDEYENMDFLSRNYPDKFIMSSEGCNGYLPFQLHALPGDWDRGVAYLFDMIKTIQKNAAAWVDWNMALDMYGGPTWAKNNLDAPVIVNSQRDEYYKSPMFYAIGHFSKFVERNSTRLDHRLAYARYDYPLEAVGFRTPNDYIVIVALNANHYRVPFKIIVDRKLVRIVTLRADSFNTIIFKWKSPTSN